MTAPNEELLADLEEAMRDVVDPELGINVVDLGLVYGLDVEKSDAGDVALNMEALSDVGLIQLYQTILNRGRHLSLDLGINNAAANPYFGPMVDMFVQEFRVQYADQHPVVIDAE